MLARAVWMQITTPEERLELKPGDQVKVRTDFGILEYVIKHEPVHLECGDWVVGLKGTCGGFALERVVAVVRPASTERE